MHAQRKSGLPKLPKPKRNLRQEAVTRLFLEPGAMDGVPLITPVWKAAQGGIKQVIDALRSSEDAAAICFLAKYDSLSQTDRKFLSIEEIAVASGIATKRLHEVASSSLLEMEDAAAAFMLATSKRKLIRKSLENAMQPKGWSDRENMLKATGVLPTPKGSPLNMTFNTANLNAPPEPRELPSAEQRLEIVQKAMETRRLAAPKEPIVIPAVDVNLAKRQEIVGTVLE